MEGHDSFSDYYEAKMNFLLEMSEGELQFPCLLCYKPFASIEGVQFHVDTHFVDGKPMKRKKRSISEHDESNDGYIAWRGPVTEKIEDLEFLSHSLQLKMAHKALSLQHRLANQNQYHYNQYLEHDRREEQPFSNDNIIELTNGDMIVTDVAEKIDLTLKL